MHHNFIDAYSYTDSFLCRRDPRVKLFVFGLFILLVLLQPSTGMRGLVFYGVLLAVVFIFSHLPLRPIAGRILTLLPFVLLTGWSMRAASGGLAVTVIKAVEAMVAVFLMVSTTPFPRLLKALEAMRCPSIVIRMLSFLYRYIYLILDEFMKMRQAQLSRTVGGRLSPGRQAKIFSSILGHLFVRSYEKGERVYLAMCARGYDGTVRVLAYPGFARTAAWADGAFLVISILIMGSLEALCLMPWK
ncbi:MAG: energy-coupling factor transporter transmembrane protein EcfT [Candidatus Velamenicoccus archaeovorus]